MCIKSYRANSSGELSLNKGDIVESNDIKLLNYITNFIFLSLFSFKCR
jgi:hypothetical protein